MINYVNETKHCDKSNKRLATRTRAPVYGQMN